MYNKKNIMEKKKKRVFHDNIFVSINKIKQNVFIQVLIFNVNLNVQFWFQSLLGFVDILCFYFQQKELNGVTLSALLCLHSPKKRNVKNRKRRAWLFWTQCTRKVYCLLLISKRVFNERLHILVLLFFYLFVCKFWLWNLFIFPPRKWDPIYL